MNKKAVIIGVVALSAVSVAVYFLFFNKGADAAAAATAASGGTTPLPTTNPVTGLASAGGPSAVEVAGARQSLLGLLPSDARFQGMVNALTDTQAVALQNWNTNGRPNTWQSDPVLGPVLTAFKNANNYFF